MSVDRCGDQELCSEAADSELMEPRQIFIAYSPCQHTEIDRVAVHEALVVLVGIGQVFEIQSFMG